MEIDTIFFNNNKISDLTIHPGGGGINLIESNYISMKNFKVLENQAYKFEILDCVSSHNIEMKNIQGIKNRNSGISFSKSENIIIENYKYTEN